MGKGLYGAQEMFEHIEAALMRSHRLGSESQRLVRKAIVYIHQIMPKAITREDWHRHVNASDGAPGALFPSGNRPDPMIYLNATHQPVANAAGHQQDMRHGDCAGLRICDVIISAAFSGRKPASRR